MYRRQKSARPTAIIPYTPIICGVSVISSQGRADLVVGNNGQINQKSEDACPSRIC